MTLVPGARLGPYEIQSPIGAGGMGEVYRARDTRLDRTVAIKVLPAQLASDPQFRDRFDREAKAISQLNHPHICTLYDIGSQDGTDFLVMEYLDGDTLADKLAKGPLPLDQALRYAIEIAGALDKAHRAGIVHRDLKPGNVMLTKGGTKLLDFGLAKTGAPAVVGVSLSMLPTTPPNLTAQGTILGTFQYMAPEQLEGQEADSRTDIFAFGAVLYEMLAGRKAFQGKSQASLISAIMSFDPPPLSTLEPLTPPALDRVVTKCLAKDPDERWQSAHDLTSELKWVAEAGSQTGVASPVVAPRRGPLHNARLAWSAAGLFLIALVVSAFVVVAHFREAPPPPQSVRFQIPTPGASVAQMFTLSADGRSLAFIANTGGPNQVWVRAMDTLDTRALAGTDGATYPFWSPDGAYLGFFAQGKLKKIAIAGGPALTLCDATSGRGGTWNRDGVIVFSGGPTSPLVRVSAAGGVPAPVTTLVEGSSGTGGHRFPVFLPDGVHVLYTAGPDKPDAAGVYLGSLDGAVSLRMLPDPTNALYAPPATRGGSGYLMFRREDTLMAQPFDLKALKLTGEMFPVAEQVPIGGHLGFGAFSASENGTLVYRTGGSLSNREVVWVDRTGKRLRAVTKPGAFASLATSPDQQTVAVTLATGGGGQSDIWLQDLGRDVISRFTFRPGITLNRPIWSPDGSRLVFASGLLGTNTFDIYQKPAGGNGQEELLVHASANGVPEDWSPDGKWIVYRQTSQKADSDLWLLPLDGERKPIPYLQTPFDERNARFSPGPGDAPRWMAYQSNESGQNQIYVQAIPASGPKYQISTSGGTQPAWRRDGKELFYLSTDLKLMAVPIKLGTTVEPGTPQELFATAAAAFGIGPIGYAPSPDGERFLVNVPAGGEGATTAPITVVLNWQAGLKK